MSERETPKPGPLARFNGAKVSGPDWFEQAIATPAESNWVNVEGARIHYLRWGGRDKPGLLLIHGNGAHAFWWSFIAPFLAREYNVAAMDLSGMGDSEPRAHYVDGILRRGRTRRRPRRRHVRPRGAAGLRRALLRRFRHHHGGRAPRRETRRHRDRRFAGQSARSAPAARRTAKAARIASIRRSPRRWRAFASRPSSRARTTTSSTSSPATR